MNRVFHRLLRSSSVLTAPSPTVSSATKPKKPLSASCTIRRWQQQRPQSSKSNVTAAAADRRLAGRQRFYKNVGIAPSSAPNEVDQMPQFKVSQPNEDGSVQSPISAGVDGTQSATGVNISINDTSSWSSRLNPHGKSPPSGWHTVTLDGRALRTPLGLPLTLPSAHLALAVASEWDAQEKVLRPAQMPLMTLCCTAIDQVASDPSAHQQDVMRYLRNDTVCYWACPTEDRLLHRRQTQAWEGLHKSLSMELLGLSDDLGPSQAIGGGEALVLSRSSEAAQRVEGHESKVQTNAKWAVRAARVEEELNIETWGLVEGGHDYDRLNCSIQMHSASFLAQTVSDSVLWNVDDSEYEQSTA
eukprot:g12237.t1 g12237   contig6:1518944-1520169(+)